MPLKDRCITSAEAMERLGIKSPTTLWHLRRRHKDFPKPIRFGTNLARFSERELEAWISRQGRSDLYARPLHE